MPTTSDDTRKALQLAAENKQKAEAIFLRRMGELREKSPRLRDIEKEFCDIGIQISKAALRGGGGGQEIAALQKKADMLTAERKSVLAGLHADESDLSPNYSCALCSDTGFSGGKLCPCIVNAVQQFQLQKLNASSPLRLSSFDTFNLRYYPSEPDDTGVSPRKAMSAILAFCKDYAADFGPEAGNVIFYGGTGLGKTHLSLAIAAGVIKKGYHVLYGSTQNLLNAVSNEHFDRADNSQSNMNSLLDCDFLILDDLGAEFSNSFTVAAVYNIINSRLASGKPTLISTNLTIDQLEQKYSDRIRSRIKGHYIPFHFAGRDVRLEKNVM